MHTDRMAVSSVWLKPLRTGMTGIRWNISGVCWTTGEGTAQDGADIGAGTRGGVGSGAGIGYGYGGTHV